MRSRKPSVRRSRFSIHLDDGVLEVGVSVGIVEITNDT